MHVRRRDTPFEDAEPGEDHRIVQRWGPIADALKRTRETFGDLPVARHEEWPAEAIEGVFSLACVLKKVQGSDKACAKIVETVSQRLHQHPGDVFVLYDVPGLGVRESVALLRFMKEVSVDAIGLQAGDAVSRELPYYRIGGLLSPYRYDLTRRLGAVFSDIGLPDEYEKHKKSSAKRIAESLVREP